MKKESITHKDMIETECVRIRKEILPFSTVHGTIWEHPDDDSYCGLLLYIPLKKDYAEKVLTILRYDEEKYEKERGL